MYRIISYILLPFYTIMQIYRVTNDLFPFGTYYTKRAITLAIYLYTVYLSITMFLLPTIYLFIDMYGGWQTLGYILLLNIVAITSSFVFILTPKPERPQATSTNEVSS